MPEFARNFSLLSVIVAGFLAPLMAQTATIGDHRLRLTGGYGYGEIQPGIVNEAPNAWLINTALANDPQTETAIPVDRGSVARYASHMHAAQYAYKDRLFLQWSYYRIDQSYGRRVPTRVTYFHPDGASASWSLFEGIRMVRYDEQRRNVELKYLHPMLVAGFKAGFFAGGEGYREINNISFGSYIATKGSASHKPGVTSWSAAAAAPGEYDLYGPMGGLALQFQLFDYLGFHYQGGIVARSGSFHMTGIQMVEEQKDGAFLGRSFIGQAAWASVRDRGMRHNLEAVLRLYCRYEIHLGVLREDIQRDYELYLGDSIKGAEVISQKTYGLGLGEMLTGARMHKNEIYLRFSVSAFP